MTFHSAPRITLNSQGRLPASYDKRGALCADRRCARPVRREGERCSEHTCWFGSRLVPHVHREGGPIVTDCVVVVPLRRSA